VSDTPEPPHGVWMSEEPRIILYFKSEYQLSIYGISYIGLYTIDGVETKVFTQFGNGLQFRIFHLEKLDEYGVLFDDSILSGSYRVVGNEIHYEVFYSIEEIRLL